MLSGLYFSELTSCPVEPTGQAFYTHIAALLFGHSPKDSKFAMNFRVRVEPLDENNWDLSLIPVVHYIGWHIQAKNLDSAKRWATAHVGAILLDGAWRVDPDDITIVRCRMVHGGFLVIRLTERHPDESTQISTDRPVADGHPTAQSQYCLLALQLRAQCGPVRQDFSDRSPRRRSRH